MRVLSLGQENPLEKEMDTHSNILAWKIPWTEEPGRLQSTGLQRVYRDWSNMTCMHTPLPHSNCVVLVEAANSVNTMPFLVTVDWLTGEYLIQTKSVRILPWELQSRENNSASSVVEAVMLRCCHWPGALSCGDYPSMTGENETIRQKTSGD